MTKIQTRSGRMVDVKNVCVDDVCMLDIVTSLSRLARFNGHTRSYYSVAQHCVVVSCLAEHIAKERGGVSVVDAARWGLLHDAHEAYIGDIASPLKPLAEKLCLCDYGIDNVVRRRFGLESLSEPVLAVVREADHAALLLERRCLLDRVEWPDDPGCSNPHVDGLEVVPQSMGDAAAAFVIRFDECFCYRSYVLSRCEAVPDSRGAESRVLRLVSDEPANA